MPQSTKASSKCLILGMVIVQLMPLDLHVCKTVFVEVLNPLGRQVTCITEACKVLKILDKDFFVVIFALFPSKI